MAVLRLCGNAFVGFLDFSVGVFLVSNASIIFGHSISLAQLLLGGALAIVPDIDLAYDFIRTTFSRNKADHDHHQYITHRPLIMIPVSLLMGLWLGGTFWAIITPLCVFWHYLHDTEGFGGGGIAWFWPFSKKYYSPRRTVNPEHSTMSEWKNRHNEYLDSAWLEPTITSLMEIIIGTNLIAITAWRVLGAPQALTIFCSIWVIIIGTWSLRANYPRP